MQNDFITRAGAQKARFCKTWSRAAKKRASCRGGAWQALFRPAACKKAAGGKGFCDAIRSSVALRAVGCVLAPLLAAAAAAWLPPAAKEGQGDCDFPLGPPWILLYPLKRRRSAVGLEAAGRCILARRSAVVAKVLLCVLPLPCGMCGAFLRRFWLRQQPCGCLRRPRRARGIAISP